MKIAIFTLCTHNNYGNRLQNYALQKFLYRYTNNVDTIWYENNNYLPELPSWNKKILLKLLLNWKNIRRKFKYYYGRECIREYNIRKFSDQHINIRYDFEIKEHISNKYDFFIVGSDQVWNPYYPYYYDAKFLNFTENEKKIAYAASFGVSEIPKNRIDFFKSNLKNIKYISVREKAGAQIISKLIDKSVPVLVDPTLLLKKREWETLEKRPYWYNGEKYILTYFLGKISPIIKDFSQKYNLKIYNLMDKNNLNLYVSGVEEFIYLIKNAQLVCTDSFHATVFSILMNTPFLVLNREEKGVADMTSRIDTLLELFNFQDRYITNSKHNLLTKEIFNMDFSKVEDIQNKQIVYSKEFLEKAMGLK